MIKKKFKELLNSSVPARKPMWILFFITLFIQGSLFLKLNQVTLQTHPEAIKGKWSNITGDADSYIDPLENLIKYKSYFWYNKTFDKKVFAGRMPYYGLIYYAFRQIFNESDALDAVVSFQLIVHCLAIIALSLISFSLIRKNSAFWITWLIYVISMDTLSYVGCLVPEALGMDCLIFFCYFFQLYFSKWHFKYLIYSSVALAFLVAFKPYFIVLYFFVFILLFKKANEYKSFTNRFRLKRSLIFIFPIVLLLLPWTIRNYKVLNRFVPLQSDLNAGYGYNSEPMKAYWNFLKAWGGSRVAWDKHSAACFFESTRECEYDFPSYAFANGYSMADLEDAKNKLTYYNQNSKSEKAAGEVIKKFNSLTGIYKKERPFMFYMGAPIIRIYKFIFQSGSYYLATLGSRILLGLKYLQSLIYYCCIFLGTIALFIYRKNYLVLLFGGIFSFIIFLFPLYLGATEWRYFAPIFPLLLCLTGVLTGDKFFNGNNVSNS